MAERRMFAKTIIDSDAFLTLPLSSQALYFHLSMRGDDEGFVNKPKAVMRTISASEDDLKLLIAKNFIIPFESGIIVIKHWKIHNYIRGDRIKSTVYQEEKKMIGLKDNGAYTIVENPISEPPCQTYVSQVSAQDRIGEDRLGKVRLERGENFIPPTLDDLKDYHSKNKMTFDVQKFFEYFSEGDWIDSHGNPVLNWKQKMHTWQNTEKAKPTQSKKNFTVEKEQKYTEEELEEMLLKKEEEDQHA